MPCVPSYLSYLWVRWPLWGDRRGKKMVFPAAIRGKSQRWVALPCDAHVVPAGQGKIRQPCVRSSSEPDLEPTFFYVRPFCAGNSSSQVTKSCTDPHQTLINISMLGTYSKFVRKMKCKRSLCAFSLSPVHTLHACLPRQILFE